MSADLKWVASWLSPARWQAYLDYCDGHQERSLALYEWNLDLAGAVLHDVAHVEVAIRNAFNQVFIAHWEGTQSWMVDASSPVQQPLQRRRRGQLIDVNARNRTSISEALTRIHSKQPTLDQVIAELPFGFWRHMTDAAHEKTVWIPDISRVFPPGTSRKLIEQNLAIINVVRNRVSHHEPLFSSSRRQEVEQAHTAITHLESLLLPQLADHTDRTSRITKLLASQPGYFPSSRKTSLKIVDGSPENLASATT